ncbi:hypothetical protein AVEN_147785-1, partial [Araneus ventricosus]
SWTDSKVGPRSRVAVRTKSLPRLEPCDEGSKSEIRGVGEGIEGKKSGSRGRKNRSTYCQRTLELHMNGPA